MRHLDPDRSALEFLAPGLLHALGNSLFEVEGCVALMEGDTARREQAAAACREARNVLALARVLVGDPGGPQRLPSGDLLEGLGRLLRVPLREAGLALEVRVGNRGPVVRVGPLVAGVAVAVRRLGAKASAGLGARIVLTPEAPRSGGGVLVTLEPPPGGLPFAVDVAAAATEVTAEVAGSGILVEEVERGLRLLPSGARPQRPERAEASTRQPQEDSPESVV